jgi:TatD DNase family protein
MKIVDTHIHLADLSAKDLKNLVENDKIEQFICVSTKESEWEMMAHFYELYHQYMIPAFGIHPWYSKDLKPSWDVRLEKYLKKYPMALVGEIGLDRLKNPKTSPQTEVLEIQLKLAKKLNRPAILHSVKANDWMEQLWDKMPPKFVFHSYSGREEFLKKIVSKNGYVSFSPSILKNKLKHELINLVPKDKILIETDAPFQGDIEEIFNVAYTINEAREENMLDQLYQNSVEFLNVG